MIDKYKIADKYFAPFGDPKELSDAVMSRRLFGSYEENPRQVG